MSESYYTRTTLDERIFAANGGAELMPVKLLPRFLHVQYQSIKNMMTRGKFPLPVVQFAGRNYVKTETLVRYLQGCERPCQDSGFVPRKRGRKSNRERAIGDQASSLGSED